MSEYPVWTTMVLIGAGTLLLRLSFIGLVGHGQLPWGLRQALRFVPPAVLSALVVPAVLGLGHAGGAGAEPVRWLAALVAAAVAWRWGNVLWTMGAGMGVLWLGTALLGG